MSNHKRQGDVLMIERNDIDIEKLRKDGKRESKDRVILAEGEATGHAHRIEERPKGNESIEIFNMGSVRMIHIPESFGTTKVQHEEHATVTLEPGTHEVRIQREYIGNEIKNVMD